jgi:asparagine synthase (glutamine-hydrolysing)
MCGIGGIIGPRPDRDWRSWAARTSYRGPDALDLWSDEHALLAHNRLSIIDLSAAANQPMASHDQRYVVVFNGEIFNFLELRAELEARGVVFKTHSDTEVLLEGYVVWGEAVLARLEGMFAFAIWDKATRQLFAARDHAGIKPFFYSCHRGVFVFGSEIKVVLESGLVPRDIRQDGIVEYLAYSYVPAPHTAFAHIQCLEPGESIRFDLGRNQASTQRWWNLPVVDRPLSISFDEAKAELARLFSQSIRRRLIADVPLGAFLSGGVDSSVIVAEMASVSHKKVKTFAIGYRNNAAYDESPHAEEVAAHLGVEHETIYPELGGADLDGYLDLIVNQFDQPYGNATVILTSILTRNVRDKVTVALVGDGGDELFGGYPRYWALGQQERFGPLVRLVRGPLLGVMRMLPETPKGNHVARRLRRFLTASDRDLGVAFEESTRLFPAQQLRGLIQPEFESRAARQAFLAGLFHSAGGVGLTRACYTDQLSFLPYNLLEGADRMSMVNSFELRLPFLDRDLMEFAAALPPEFRIRGRLQKRLLKEVYRGKLPDAVFNRPKRGFNPPVWHWLKENRNMLEPIASLKGRLAEYVDPVAIRGLLDRFDASMEDNSTQLWSLLVLGRWLARQG